MIFYKTDEEIEKIREACHLVCKTLALVGSHLKPGVSGKFLDQLAEEFILDHGARPAFKGYRSFPATLCFSPNEVVVHGIPTDAKVKPTDIISVDCGVELNGYYGDAAYTFALTEVSEPVLKLCSVTRQSLYLAIDQATHGKRIGDVSFAVQNICERQHRYGIVRELTGHGVGKSLHEEPDVPNYGRRGEGTKILDGLVIAIEPMITQGRRDVAILDDEWTIITKDRKAAAHYEHTIAVRKQKADILSDHSYIEEAIKNNPELIEIP